MSFIGDLLGNFTGSRSGSDLAAAKAKSDADLTAGYTTGRADLGGAIGRLDPYATGGGAAYQRYLRSLGVEGTEAQAGVEREYNADPIQNQLMDRITKANTRGFTARGMNNSGAATQSLTNSLLDNWRKYQEQLGGAGGTGQAAATTQAGLQKDQGDMAFGYGSTQAGNDINYGNAVAANRNTGINNLFSIASIGAQFARAAAGGGARPAA